MNETIAHERVDVLRRTLEEIGMDEGLVQISGFAKDAVQVAKVSTLYAPPIPPLADVIMMEFTDGSVLVIGWQLVADDGGDADPRMVLSSIAPGVITWPSENNQTLH